MMHISQTASGPGALFARVLDPANRADPYPLYAELRETPVAVQDDGTYVVSTYAEIDALLHDPRISSDERKSTRGAGALVASGVLTPQGQPGNPPFFFLDPPEHDRLRHLVMQQFTAARVEGVRARVTELVEQYLNAQRDRGQLDIVDDLAYPLPLRVVVSELLGMPREDEPHFRRWTALLARSLDGVQAMNEDEMQVVVQTAMHFLEYMATLIAERQKHPTDDLISALIAGGGPAERMSDADLLMTVMLLLFAGHETPDPITNGTLALLRHPEALARLRREPDLVIPLVEEVMRFDSPVHFRTRTTLTDIPMAGVTIPKGATVVLLLASGNRDERRFPQADRFIPNRTDNGHLGFGGGIHSCIGMPLVRMEAQIALSAIAHRLVAPRLMEDPPPYGDNAALRRPLHLLVAFDRLAE